LYPPGTRVECIDPISHMLLAGTVMDIPLTVDSSTDVSSNSTPSYTVLFDNGTSASIPLRDMASIIPKPPIDVDPSDSQDSLLPPFLRLHSKITYEHDGQYHKGYLGQLDGVYRFVFKSHANKRKEEWGQPSKFAYYLGRSLRRGHSSSWSRLSFFSPSDGFY
jgi:hypothetical protein